MTHDATPMRLSLVVPVYNERPSLGPLMAEIESALDPGKYDFEVVFIDDGSTDGSWAELEKLWRDHPRMTAVRFRRNFGKAAALQAGFARARGCRVVTLDADLQDDPAEIPRLLAKIDEGYDLVSGWKKIRHDPWHKVLPSRLFNKVTSMLTGVELHDINCGLKAYRAEVLSEIQLYGEFHRFTPALAAARGFRISEIEIRHRPRTHGVSKYGWTRFISGLIDLLTVKFLTSYQHRPQHLLGLLGMMSMGVGTLGIAYLSAVWLLTRMGLEFAPIGSRPLLLFSVTAVLAGLQIFSLGLIGELITFRVQRDGEQFSVAQTLERKYTSPSTNDAMQG